MKLIAKRLEERYPDSNRRVGAIVVPLAWQVGTRIGLIVSFAASGFVLLIACANLQTCCWLAHRRVSVTSRSMGFRRRARGDIRQLLTESLLLASLGAVSGGGLARLAMIALEKLVPEQLAATSLHIDWRMMLFRSRC